MRIEIILKNYRCFPESRPAHIIIEDNWTAFVGVNNAGKSALLRFFYEFRPLFREFSSSNMWHVAAQGQVRGTGLGDSVRDAMEVFHNQNQRPLAIEFRVSSLATYPDRRAMHPTSVRFEYKQELPLACRLTQVAYHTQGDFPLGSQLSLTDDTVLTRDNIRIDIAPYRDAMERLGKTFYVGAFRNILNTGSKNKYFDIQVGDAFITRWREMQTGNSKRENRASEEVATIIERLFGYNRLSIQAAQSNDTLQLVIDHRPYKLHELGAGLAQFIMVLANAAVAQANGQCDYILIDEPELNLHPSLQLDFLSALAGFARYGMFFTTHSIGLARSAADSIYSVLRVRDGESRVVRYEATPNLPEFLGAMSYSSYQALGFSKVLLVEGPSEVRAIQQFLRKLDKDHKILLLQLGGSSLINPRSDHELSELKRITPDLFALINSEKTSASAPLDKDREGFQASCAKLGIDCHVLEYRALENYLTERAIQRVKGDKYRKLGVYESLKNADPRWGKPENWKIASEMSWDDIKDTDLGQFLARL